MTRVCAYCGEAPASPGRTTCPDCDDLPGADPLAPAPISLVVLRRMRRKLSSVVSDLDQLERRTREAQR
jgi:hypothetical protein